MKPSSISTSPEGPVIESYDAHWMMHHGRTPNRPSLLHLSINKEVGLFFILIIHLMGKNIRDDN